MEVIGRLHAISALTETVILTGHASVDSAVRALREHTSDYLVKPVAPDQLLTTVERASERWQRRRAEEALRRSEERSQLLLENISDVVVVVDEALMIGYVSPSVTRVLGVTPDELIGQRWGGLTHPDDVRLLEQFVRQIREGTSIEPSQELRVRHHKGDWRVLDMTAANLIGRGESNRELVLTGRDVTERRRLEVSSASRRRWRASAASEPACETVSFRHGFATQVRLGGPRDLGGPRLRRPPHPPAAGRVRRHRRLRRHRPRVDPQAYHRGWPRGE